MLVAVNLPAVAHQPQMLSGGDAVLYTLGTLGSPGRWDTAQIVVERVATGERSVLVEGGSDARYVPTGHLVYAQGGTLLAVPFDVDRLVVTGSPVPLVEGISRAGVTGAANADISRTGVLVNLPVEEGPGGVRTLVWVDRDGTENALAAPPRDYVYPRLSPDGRRVILDARDEENDVWVWDLRRETLMRLTFEADADYLGMWTARRAAGRVRLDPRWQCPEPLLARGRRDGRGRTPHREPEHPVARSHFTRRGASRVFGTYACHW